ncbi:MAG TPA: cupin domain-containing protein [Bryobacteraceae bacterium]
MKPFLLFILSAGLLAAAAPAKVDVYSAAQLHSIAGKLAAKNTPFADTDLAAYKGHRTMLAVRKATGSAEFHAHDADIFFVVSGSATLVTGGKLVNPKTLKPGEIRGSSIRGGERHRLSAGDIVHIPARTPHWILVNGGKPFAYFVVKVSDQ